MTLDDAIAALYVREIGRAIAENEIRREEAGPHRTRRWLAASPPGPANDYLRQAGTKVSR
jgi:hypothetical protein